LVICTPDTPARAAMVMIHSDARNSRMILPVSPMPFHGIQMMGKGVVIQLMRMLDYLESR